MAGGQGDDATEHGGRSIWKKLLEELGLYDLYHAGHDVHILNAMRFGRMFGYSAIALILAEYLTAMGFSKLQLGQFMTLVLLGDLFLTFGTSVLADRIGRRATLMFWSAVMAGSGVIFALCTNYYVLLVAAMLGVISTSGNEVGPFRGVEESILAHLVEPAKRTAIYTGYVILAMLGTAAGLPVSGLLTDRLQKLRGWSVIDAYRAVFWIYAGLGAFNVVLTALLSKRCELVFENEQRAAHPAETDPLLGDGEAHQQRPDRRIDADFSKPESAWRKYIPILPGSDTTVVLLCALFMIDSFASGMMPYSIINFYVQQKFIISGTALGAIMAGAQLFAVPSTLLATPLAKRIGPIRAMVAVHMIAALFLGLTPAPQSLAWTFILNYARSVFNGMDQAPRAAFVASAVKPEERTTVNGLAMICKTFATIWGPSITGILMDTDRFWLAFVLAGVIKALYDVGLLACFEIFKLHQQKEDPIMDEAAEEPHDERANGHVD